MNLGDRAARVAVFASGNGSTFQALLDHSRSRGTGWSVDLLVTDRERPGAADRAESAGVVWVHVPVKGREPVDVAHTTLELLEEHQIDLVLLAGYLRLIPEAVVEHFAGRMLNTHPSLLPAFGGQGMYGRHVHEAVVASGARVSGPTVQWVDREYDRGRPLAQWPVPVLESDDASALAARVQSVERVLYPQVVDHIVASWSHGRPVAPLPFEGTSFVLDSSAQPTLEPQDP